MAETLFNNTGSNIKVSLGGSGSIAGQAPNSSNTVTLSTTASVKRRLTEMEDVDDTAPIDGGTLIFNETTSTYELRAMNVDGGTF